MSETEQLIKEAMAYAIAQMPLDVKEIAEIKAENEKLKEQVENLQWDIDNDLYTEDQMDEAIGEEREKRERMVSRLHTQDNENEKLKEEIKELKEANDTFTLGAKRTIESNCKLYQENEKLKERQSIMSAAASVHIDDINQIHQDYGDITRKLEEQMLELVQEKHKVIQDAYNTHYETWKKEQDNITITELKEEISNLQADNEKIRDEHKGFEKFVGSIPDGTYHWLGKVCSEDTALEIIESGVMERNDFQCFNPDWESQHQ